MDKTIKCRDCGTEFVFPEYEQKFYLEKGFNDPVRCKSCRDIRKASYQEPQPQPKREFPDSWYR